LIELIDLNGASMSASYEKVIKVKADVAASSYFSYIADPGVVGGELSRAGAVRKRSS
jgi:hypothetical protein